jgi:putative endonuclease
MGTTDKIKRGNEGEQLAADFLIQKGFEVVARNYRHKHAEIDLIVTKGNWLIFVEVKTRSSSSYGHPEEFVDYHKVKTILLGAEQYMCEKDWQGNVRYDIVSILLKRSGPEIVHIEDAFY